MKNNQRSKEDILRREDQNQPKQASQYSMESADEMPTGGANLTSRQNGEVVVKRMIESAEKQLMNQYGNKK